MKRKVLYICLGIFMLIDSALVNYILEREPVCERTHWSDADRSKDIVPDEETAMRLAEASFRMEKSGWGYQEDVNYQVEVDYHEPSYEWIVTYAIAAPKGYIYLDGTRTFGVRRDNGLVLAHPHRKEIDCHASW